MSEHLTSAESAGALRAPRSARASWPSYVYVTLAALNTAAISAYAGSLLVLPLVVVQSLFFVGLLELTHQSVHRNFVSSKTANELLGTIAAGLIGFNLVAYRYFHFEHHRHTCDEADPEGLLYAGSPSTRWIWLIAPAAQAWVAVSINRLAGRYVPSAKSGSLRRARLGLGLMLFAVMAFAVTAPQSFLMAYLIPFCGFAWIDFLFSQAEHYGFEIREATPSRDRGSVTHDVRVPSLFSQLMLHRNLHRVHHVWPQTRWYEAPRRLRALQSTQPEHAPTFAEFASRWMRQGPRLWTSMGSPTSGGLSIAGARTVSSQNTTA